MSKDYLRVFKALSDPKRVRILEILCKSEECACVLLDDLEISQPTLSYHMKILCDSGIVTGRKVGKWMYYRINEDGCEYASKLIDDLKEHRMDGVLKIMHLLHKLRYPGNVRSRKEGSSGNKCCDTI